MTTQVFVLKSGADAEDAVMIVGPRGERGALLAKATLIGVHTLVKRGRWLRKGEGEG